MGSAVGERYWDVYYTYSRDGGRSWENNLRVANPSLDGDVQAEDAYFSRVRFEQTPPLGTDADSTPGWQWALLGAAGALVVGGLVLGAGVHNAREAASSP